METPLPIASLHSQAGQSCVISFHDIEICTQRHSSEVFSYYHTSQESIDHSSRYSKAIARGHKIAVRAALLLNRHATGASSMRSTGDGLVGGEPCEGDSEIVEDILWFEKITFEFHHPLCEGPMLKSTNYLHFSSPAAQIVPDNFGCESLSIIAGTCLFSGDIIQSSVPTSKRIDAEKLRSAGPTLYEVEHIARVAPVIADFAALLYKTSASHRQQTRLNLCLDIPNFHYYQAIEEHLRNGSCTFNQALQWMDAVQKRHAQIASVFRLYIDHLLLQRNVESFNISVQVTPSADWVFSDLRQSLANGVLPTLEPYLNKLSTDPVWTSFYRLIPDTEKPQDFKALGCLFYVYQVVRPGLVENLSYLTTQKLARTIPIGDAVPSRLIISIDDQCERRIYSRAQKVLRRMRNTSANYPVPFNLLEVYSSKRVFLNMNQRRSNLYVEDPSPEKLVLGVCSNLSKCENTNGDIQPCTLDAFDVVGKLYTQSASTKLKQLFKKLNVGP